MTATLDRPDLAALTDAQLSEVSAAAGDPDAGAAAAEIARRRATRAAKIRSASRERRTGADAAAYANYLAASAYCNGDANMLSEAGRRTGREAWPMLWEGSRERIEHLCSHDLIVWWDYHQPRPPSSGEYARAGREAAAGQQARASAPSPGMLAAMAAARGEASGKSPAPVAARAEPGSLVRFTALLRQMRNEAEQAARAFERVNGGTGR